MDPNGGVRQEEDQDLIGDYTPPTRNIAPFVIIGVAILVLLIVASVIFLLVRARTNVPQPQNGEITTLTPQPTPSFYELLSRDIQEQEVKVSEIGDDIRELESVFTYESVNFSDILTPPPTQTPEFESQKTEIAKARAELEIDRRIAVLDKLIPKIDVVEKLSSAQKSILISEVNSEISVLSDLRERVSARTDFSALTADINTLSESYKNYQVLVPKALTVVIVDKIIVFGESFTDVANKLSQKTGELHALEKNVEGVQKTLGHMLFVLGDSLNKAESAVVAVFSLSPSDDLKNRSILIDAKAKVQESHRSLSLAVTDGKNIINTLMTVESGSAPSGNFFQFFPLFRL